MVKGLGAGYEGRGDLGVRFDKLNELRGEAGKVLEPVERPGAGAAWEGGSPLGVRFDLSTWFDPSTGSGTASPPIELRTSQARRTESYRMNKRN